MTQDVDSNIPPPKKKTKKQKQQQQTKIKQTII